MAMNEIRKKLNKNLTPISENHLRTITEIVCIESIFKTFTQLNNHFKSNLSRFITLFQALTKSITNFS